ncbi:MAG: hypothetical protein JXJ18_00320 [Rhodobacteraceae bacterium]|nr:hypothetical protein [Paracoccaceae bacterium]
MKTFLKLVLGLAVLGVIGYAAVIYFTSGQRDIARQFVILTSTGQYPQARTLLHPQLQEQYTLPYFQETFAGVAPYAQVSFTSLAADGTSTRLGGTATTASGCASKLSFEVLKGQIIAFDITPLCKQ